MDEPASTGPDERPVFEFAPVSQFRHPRQFLRASARSLRASLPLARRLFVRDIRARYRLSALGFAWIVLPALAQTAVWLYLNNSQIIDSGETTIPLPLYILLGTLLWQGFTDALFAPGNQLTNSSQMLTRVAFPPESLLVAGFADATVNTVVRLLVALPVIIYYRVVPGWGLLLAPFGLLLLLILGFAIGLALAPFSVLYGDVSRLLAVATGFWMLITPVAYVIPDTGPGRWLAILNPVSAPLSATRDWLTGGQIAPGEIFLVVAVCSLGLLGAGWVLFRLALPHLVDRVGN